MEKEQRLLLAGAGSGRSSRMLSEVPNIVSENKIVIELTIDEAEELRYAFGDTDLPHMYRIDEELWYEKFRKDVREATNGNN